MARIEDYEAFRGEIVRLLQEERTRRGLSKYVISKRSGVSQSMLSLVERGKRNPTLELVLRVADAIGVDLAKIIKRARARKQGTVDWISEPAHSQSWPAFTALYNPKTWNADKLFG
jgi:transcriptional regulator with XRE-family HTH domain